MKNKAPSQVGTATKLQMDHMQKMLQGQSQFMLNELHVISQLSNINNQLAGSEWYDENYKDTVLSAIDRKLNQSLNILDPQRAIEKIVEESMPEATITDVVEDAILDAGEEE